MKLTEDQKFDILQRVSGNVMTDYIPDNWRDMSSEDQDKFHDDHLWEPFEDYRGQELVPEIMTSMADAMIEYIEKKIEGTTI